MVMLASKMPKLRTFAAEQLYICTALLCYDERSLQGCCWSMDTIAALQTLLVDGRWGADDVEEAKGARLRVIRLLGLQAPKAKQRDGTIKRSRGAVAGDESYQGLLNDFARGL